MKKFLERYWPIILSVIYLIWPFDIIPDWPFPVVGAIDDTGILVLAIIREIIIYFKHKDKKK